MTEHPKHWTLDDIPWGRFDASKVDPEMLRIVKGAALVEYNGGIYGDYLASVFHEDVEFQQAAYRWASEEVQHGKALAFEGKHYQLEAASLEPKPLQSPLPLLIGGGGEKVTLRLVAEYADAWNTFGPPENFAHKSAVLDEWCAKLGREPSTIERTVAVDPDDVDDIGRYVDAGATHVIVMVGHPFDLSPLQSLIAQRDALG